MHEYRLSQQQLVELRAADRAARDVRAAYRLNAAILLGKGRSAAHDPFLGGPSRRDIRGTSPISPIDRRAPSEQQA